MIKNNRQHSATLEQIEHLKAALGNVGNVGNVEKVVSPDVIVRAHIQSLQTDIAELEQEAREYERAREGEVKTRLIEDLDEVGKELVRLRIAKGLTQKTLAEAVGQREQVIQRYEDSNYDGASLKTVKRIAAALLASSAA